jgi:hypothetical protein
MFEGSEKGRRKKQKKDGISKRKDSQETTRRNKTRKLEMRDDPITHKKHHALAAMKSAGMHRMKTGLCLLVNHADCGGMKTALDMEIV